MEMDRDGMRAGQMRVLQFIPGYRRRGAEIHVLNLMLGMQERKIPVSLALVYDTEVAEEARGLGLDVRIIARRCRGDISVVYRLAKLIRQEGFQAVHTHLINGNFYGRMAGRLAGNCCVVSDIPENLEAIANHAYTFKNRDSEDLQKVLTALIEEPEKVEEKKETARQHVLRNYSWDRIADMMEALYLSVLES